MQLLLSKNNFFGLVIVFGWVHLNFVIEGKRKWNKTKRVGVDSGRYKRSKGKRTMEAKGILAESTEIKLKNKGENFWTQKWNSGILRVSKAEGKGISWENRGSWGWEGNKRLVILSYPLLSFCVAWQGDIIPSQPTLLPGRKGHSIEKHL